MTLRVRITIFVICAVMLMTAGILFGEMGAIHRMDSRIQELILENQITAWQQALDATTAQLAAETSVVLDLPGIDQAAQDKDTTKLQQLLGPIVASGAVNRIDVLDPDGNSIYSSDPGGAGEPLIDAGIVFKIIGGRDSSTGLQSDNRGNILATVARPIMTAQNPAGVLVLASSLASTIDRLKTSSGSDVVLLDRAGRLLSASAPALWPALTATRTKLHPGVVNIDIDGHTLRVGDTVLSSGSGTRIGYALVITDITQSHESDQSQRLLSFIVIGGIGIGIALTLFWYLSRTFRPLNESMRALSALTAGDTSIDIVGEERHDEVGRLAQVTRIVRDLKRDDLRDEHMRERQRRRQERFIRNEMINLALALSEDARTELMADLDKIEAASNRADGTALAEDHIGGALGTLAIAFRYMAERVKTQYHNLDTLVAELRDALATKTALIGLQQQFQIAGQMQAAILPKTLPPRGDVEIEGRLLPAKEFGGNFYDFFLLDQDRLLMVAAEISGRGLTTAFLTIVARTLLKATLLMTPVPETALKRVNEMLLAENDHRLEVRVFVAILDLPTGRLDYSAAGYPPPLILRRLGDVTQPAFADSAPLAVAREAKLVEGALELPPRTTLVLTSSGVAEAANPLGQMLGRDGLAEALRAVDDLGARPVCDAITRCVTERSMGRARETDASCIVLRYLGR